jgi:hypothetical protein
MEQVDHAVRLNWKYQLDTLASGGQMEHVDHAVRLSWMYQLGTSWRMFKMEYVDRRSPIELEVSTWHILSWEEAQDTFDWMALCAR